jgi:hypothetical protein
MFTFLSFCPLKPERQDSGAGDEAPIGDSDLDQCEGEFSPESGQSAGLVTAVGLVG